MADVRIVHELACSVDVFWNRLFFDPEFNRELFFNRLRFIGWEVTKQTETEQEIRRTVKVNPPVDDVPAPLRAALGSGFSYSEEGRFDKSTRHYTLRAIPDRMADRLGVEGELFCEPTQEGHCRRVFVAHVEARVFGIGGMIEKRVLADLSRNYDDSALFIATYLKQHGIAPV
jgi:hypothetical protein